MLKQKLKLKIVPIVAICMIVGLSSFAGPGEGTHGRCTGGNNNVCKITDADGTVHNYTGAYISN